jgi:hypothetical protein
MDIHKRIRRIFDTGDKSYTLETLQLCCLLIAALALKTETTPVRAYPARVSVHLMQSTHCAIVQSRMHAVAARGPALNSYKLLGGPCGSARHLLLPGRPDTCARNAV